MTTDTGNDSAPTRAAAVMDYLTASGDWHRGMDIARDLGMTTHEVNATLLRLTREGRLLRRRVTKNRSLYAAPGGAR